jgi:hypothetical protein
VIGQLADRFDGRGQDRGPQTLAAGDHLRRERETLATVTAAGAAAQHVVFDLLPFAASRIRAFQFHQHGMISLSCVAPGRRFGEREQAPPATLAL